MNGGETSPDILYDGLHGALILVGVAHCFFGFKIFKAMLAFIGLFVGGALGASGGEYFFPEQIEYILAGLALGGILGAVLAFVLYKAGLFVLGVFLSFALVGPQVMDFGPEAGWLIVGAVGILFGFAALKVVTLMIKVATALTGAIVAVYGAGYFMEGPNLVEVFSQPSIGYADLQLPPKLLLIAAGMALAGMFIQMLMGRDKS